MKELLKKIVDLKEKAKLTEVFDKNTSRTASCNAVVSNAMVS